MRWVDAFFVGSLVACAASEKDELVGDTGSPAGDAPTATDAPWFCADTEVVVEEDPLGWRVETSHYVLTVATDEARARQLGVFAESSWLAMADWFGAAPPDEHLPLRVSLHPDEESWAAAIRADGSEPPTGAGGFYWPPSEEAYVLPQPTRYYEDSLVLHEMLHQFHSLARTGNENRPFWYAEGLAEALSRHDWDGECVRLLRLPLVSQEDLFAQAEAELDADGLDLGAILDETIRPSRAVAMAIFRQLSLDPALGEGFAAFRDAFDADGDDPRGTFESWVGDPGEAATVVIERSRLEREAFTPVFLEWHHRTPTRIDSYVDGVYSVARLDEGTAIEFVVDRRDTDGLVGVLAGFEGPDDQVGLLLRDDGEVSAFDVSGGAVVWSTVGAVPALGPSVSVSLDHDGSDAVLIVDGTELRVAIEHEAAAGLVVYDADVVFKEIRF